MLSIVGHEHFHLEAGPRRRCLVRDASGLQINIAGGKQRHDLVADLLDELAFARVDAEGIPQLQIEGFPMGGDRGLIGRFGVRGICRLQYPHFHPDTREGIGSAAG